MSGLKNQLISISELDELIGIATRTITVDVYGSAKETISTPTANIRAKVRYSMTNQAEGTVKQEKFTTEIVVHVRYNTSITVSNLIYWETKYYEVFAIEGTPRQRFTVIKARLITT